MTYSKDNIEFAPKPINSRFIDLTGRVFTRLTVLGYAGTLRPHRRYWFCECKCGTIKAIAGADLQCGDTQSCRCLHKDILTTHGESPAGNKSAEYKIYGGAKARCSNPKHPKFYAYGERGIKFLYTSFSEFLEDIGRRPTALHTLERKDNERGYEPGNCKWATRKEQTRNRRNNRWITINGITKCLVDWDGHNGISASTAYSRIKFGWCYNCLFTVPLYGVCVHK